MRLRIILLSLFLLLLSVDRATACSCMAPLPPCEAYKDTPAIFIALVTGIDPRVKDAKEPPYAHFSIERAFKGITETKIKMYQGTASGDCSLKFELGKRYLIYADYDDETKQFYTSFCTRTTELQYAAEDLDFLQGLPESSRVTLLSGLVVKFDFYDSYEDPSIPELLSGIAVSAEQENGKRFEAVTNSEGFFKMVDLLPGRYKLKAKLPSYLIADKENPSVVEVPKEGCVTAVFLAKTDGRISGVLLDAHGLATSGTLVELIPVQLAAKLDTFNGPYPGRYEETDKDGRFEFEYLKEGRYLLGVNMIRNPDGKNPFRRTFFPGVANLSEATVITLGKGEKLKGYELRMPPRLRVREIKGVVVWPNGKPIANAYLSFQDSPLRTSRTLTSTQTDIRGRFTIKALEGQKAWLQGSVSIPVEHGIDVMSTEAVRVVANARQPFLRLVVSGKPRRGVEIVH